MFRTASKNCQNLRCVKSKVQSRSASSVPSSGDTVEKIVKFTLGGAVVGVGGAFGYSYYDPEFRKKVEETVPQIKPVFKVILGQPRDIAHPLFLPGQKKESSDKKESTDEKPKPKVSEQKPAESSKIVPPVTVAPATTPTSASPQVVDKKAAEKAKAEDLEQRVAKREEEISRLNKKLENTLRSTLHTAEVLIKSSREAKDAVLAAIENHTKLLKSAVEDPNLDKKDPQWTQVSQASETVQFAISSDKTKEQDARAELERLRKLINEGRSSKDTAQNVVLNEASQTLTQLGAQLDESLAKVERAKTDSKIMTEFKKLIEDGRRQFADELKSILPNIDAKIRASGSKLTEDELNSLIVHAHVRVDHLRRQLAEQQLKEQQHIEQALERQKAEHSRLTEERIEQETKRAKESADLSFNESLAQARKEFEDDLRQQLRRQAAAHSEHLEDVIRVQKEQVAALTKLQVDEAVLKEREIYNKQLASAVVRLQAIELALEGRSEVDKENRRAKELWLACQQLKNAIIKGRSGKDYENRRKPLANEIMTVKEASGSDTFVNSLVGAIPDAALSSGVYNEDDLKERFSKVDKLCRRTARIGEHGGSLLEYVWSYAQSTFIWNTEKETTPETEIDTNNIDTFDILSRASYCVDKKDFETALKLLMLLKGEPARIAADWIRDTRTHLETKQAAELLLSHAAAQSVRTYY